MCKTFFIVLYILCNFFSSPYHSFSGSTVECVEGFKTCSLANVVEIIPYKLSKLSSKYYLYFWSSYVHSLSVIFSENADERLPTNEVSEEQEEDADGEDIESSSADSCEWLEPDDDELIVIETGDGAPLVGTIETAESYYVVNPHQHPFNGLSSGIFSSIILSLSVAKHLQSIFCLKWKMYTLDCAYGTYYDSQKVLMFHSSFCNMLLH